MPRTSDPPAGDPEPRVERPASYPPLPANAPRPSPGPVPVAAPVAVPPPPVGSSARPPRPSPRAMRAVAPESDAHYAPPHAPPVPRTPPIEARPTEGPVDPWVVSEPRVAITEE